MKLPATLDELHGLRAARWIRESTAGQADNFGPDAQREQQDRAIERWGLVETGLAWQVAHSGRTIGTTSQFAEMMAAAGREYDVLVVGYVSRFARDLRTAVNARHDLHAAGAVLLFADERILSSEEDRWDEWAREAVEAESYSRKLARRIREGYAAKRRRLGEPGGRAPFGYRRVGRPPRLEPDDVGCATVRAAFGRAARGDPDRSISLATGLTLDTVRGILTNPIYLGRLRDGSPASVEPLVDVATWNRVQQLRSARNGRGGRPSVKRTYLLPMLRCAACGRGLVGDSGRYRHPGTCEAFLAARPRRAFRHQLRKGGRSYPRRLYEDLVPFVLRELSIAADAADLARAAELWRSMTPAPDELALRRLEADRTRALERYREHRDPQHLEAEMAAIDGREAAVKHAAEYASTIPSWTEVVQLLRDVPVLWADPDAADEDRRRMAQALFASVDALGARSATFTLHAGAQALVCVGAKGFEPTVTITRAPWLVEELA